MEPALIQLQSQIEKLPLHYEWAFRVFINRTMPYVATYKMLATRMLELRYGIAKFTETPVTKVEERKFLFFKYKKKVQDVNRIKYWELDPERKDGYEKEMETLNDQVVDEFIPKFDERLLIMKNISFDAELLKPLIIQKDAQINYNKRTGSQSIVD